MRSVLYTRSRITANEKEKPLFVQTNTKLKRVSGQFSVGMSSRRRGSDVFEAYFEYVSKTHDDDNEEIAQQWIAT